MVACLESTQTFAVEWGSAGYVWVFMAEMVKEK